MTNSQGRQQFEMFEGGSDAPQKVIKLRELERPLWTKNKAKLIERYLYYFVLVTKHGTYIDGFGGPQSPTNEDMWAAKLVLESRPRWLRTIVLGDIKTKQVERLNRLVSEQPPRDKEKREPTRHVIVKQGDFNIWVDDALTHVKRNQAAFCLLDQRTFKCKWATVSKIARYKSEGNKIELFYFLPVGWLPRAVSGLKKSREEFMEQWWGKDDWRALVRSGVYAMAQMTVERFKLELGYKFVNAYPIRAKKAGGRILYFMIHASDHDQAMGLMRRAYSKALDQPEPPDQLDFLRVNA